MASVRRILAILVLTGTGLLSAPLGSGSAAPAASAPGYWLAGADGGVFAFGAPFYGSGVTVPGACSFTPQAPSTLNSAFGCTAITPTPAGNGYWLLNAFRSATAYGQAGQPPQTGCTSLNGARGSWVGMASSATGSGFLMVSSNGGVLGCGDARPLGGLTSVALTAPVVGIATTPDHNGYWVVSADGGVFAFGDAGFDGSLGGTRLNAPVVGMTATADGEGYWLVAADGGVFAFGDASFDGSMGATHLNASVVGIAASPDSKGYWLAAADGGVFSFGDAPFQGSMGGKPITGPIVGIAAYQPPLPG